MNEDTYNFSNNILDSKTIVVLLVDDQAMVAEGIKRMLTDEKDISMEYCQDPSQAIKMASDLQPTIILQDLVLPEIDGMTLVRFYRTNEATKDIPIIVLSSKEDPVVKSEAFQFGANDYLVKLPDKIELIARIRSHAKHYMLQLERNAAFFALREMQKQLQKTNAELERLSSLDGLTGISNRRIFDERLIKECKRAKRENNRLVLILLDIDFFKPYNDTYGHQMGDSTLCLVAKTINSVVTRPTDLVARYGGEEFAIIAPSTDEEGAIKLAQNLNKAVKDLNIEHEASKAATCVTVSLGVTVALASEDITPEILLAQADEALYDAKHTGRDTFVVAKK